MDEAEARNRVSNQSRKFFELKSGHQVASSGEVELILAAETILNFALLGVDPATLINQSLKREGRKLEIVGKERREIIDLESFHRVFLIALGKASPLMAEACLKLLGDKVYKGIVVCLPGVEFFWPGVERLEAPHPLPDERSLKVAEKIIELSQETGEADLVFFLISGGASAQMAMPVKPVTLAEKAKVTKALMEAGADIRELNIVRKHLSEVKGGRLGRFFRQATIINLFISDVIDDDLETIASGPTTWDSSTYAEAKKIMEKYKLWNTIPESVKEVMERGLRGEIKETRKKDEIIKTRLLNFIIGHIEVAIEAATQRARELGFYPIILSRRETGEARERARLWAGLVRSLSLSSAISSNSLALISGGELTVTVRGKGRGGRNLEFCLALLKELMEDPLPENFNWCAASLATDGRDGPTEAAGAIICPLAIKRVTETGLDPAPYLNNNDSLSFFEKIGGLILTGPTGTNVMDLRLFLLKKQERVHKT